MKPSWLALLALAIVATPAANAADDQAKTELAKFQGEWRSLTMESNGKEFSPEKIKSQKLVVKGDRFYFEEIGYKSEGTLRMSPARDPKGVDFVHETPPKDKGHADKVGYTFVGDIMLFVLSKRDGYPKEFTGKAGSEQSLEVWKKVYPPTPGRP